jgi:uncharacterized DUF497 family protein
MTQRFEWDEAKNASNREKHGVTFEQASALFTDGEDYLEILDTAHSDVEDRFLAIGPIALGVVLVVWTERDEDVIRIISARWATKSERARYLEHIKREP